METHNPLEKLKDIHIPEPIDFWPLAPGWYFLIILFLLLLLFIAYQLNKRYQLNKAKMEALQLLVLAEKSYLETKDSQQASATIADVLKRVALIYYPRSEVAGLQGQSWIHFLNKTGKDLDFAPLATMLLEWPFKPSEKEDIRPLFQTAKLWIKQRRGPHV